jgi:uncharacterized coiled-coil protein SlyX
MDVLQLLGGAAFGAIITAAINVLANRRKVKVDSADAQVDTSLKLVIALEKRVTDLEAHQVEQDKELETANDVINDLVLVVSQLLEKLRSNGIDVADVDLSVLDIVSWKLRIAAEESIKRQQKKARRL